MVQAGLQGQPQIGTKERCAKFGDEFLEGVGFYPKRPEKSRSRRDFAPVA